MKNILRYKKSIFLSIVILITMITLLCTLCTFLPKQNIVIIDNDNADFCYDLAKLADAENPLNYANVKKIFEYSGDFNALELVSGNDSIELKTDVIKNIYNIAVNFLKPLDDCKQIEVFALSNTNFDNIQNLLPTFEVKNSELTTTLCMTKKPLKLYGYNNGISLKVLIRVK